MYPKELLCEVHAPGKRLVELVVTLKNIPGALSQASSAIGALGINVLSGLHTALPTETDARWSFFADLTDKAEPEQVIEALRRTGVVIEAKITKAQFPDLIIDELHFPLLVANERAVVFKLRTLAGMFRHLREISGASVARVLRHQMGLEAGEAKARHVQEQFHLAGEDALRVILAERVAKGWGIPALLKYDPNSRNVLISVTELFECVAARKRTTEPTGEFFRGYLEGALSVLMNTHVQVREIECVAKGHPRCSFTATIAEAGSSTS